jgi:DNA replication protein DnaC
MLTHPTLDQLNTLGLHGMAKAFGAMSANPDTETLSHAEWLGLILDHEMSWRQDRRMAARLRYAKLRHRAVPEDIDYRTQRGLERRFMEALLKGDWIKGHDNLVITGPPDPKT